MFDFLFHRGFLILSALARICAYQHLCVQCSMLHSASHSYILGISILDLKDSLVNQLHAFHETHDWAGLICDGILVQRDSASFLTCVSLG